MVFGLFPQRLDQIQLRAVRRKMQQHKLPLQHPAVKNFRLNVVVRGRVVHHHKGWFVCWAGAGQLIQKRHHMLTADAVAVDFKVQLCACVIERAQHIHPFAPDTGVCSVRLAARRPAALDVGQAAKAGFIQVQQADIALAGMHFHLVQRVLNASKTQLISFF